VAVVVETATVGAGSTVMVAVPVCGWLQLGVPVVATLTKLYVVVAVKAAVVTVAVPAASKVMVWSAPPSTV
jgi:hypothetical protein